MPNLVRYNLILRVLLHKADAGGLRALIHFVQRHAVEKDAAAAPAMRCQNGFKLAQ